MNPEFTKTIKGHLLKVYRDTSPNGQPIWLATYQHFWIKGLAEEIEAKP